jgi:hypothetical protein
MSVYNIKTPPPPIRSEINKTSGLFGNIWTRWLSDYFEYSEKKINVALVRNGLLSSAIVPVTISNSSTETVILSGSIDANTLLAGTSFNIKAFCFISTHSVSPTLTIKCIIGTGLLTGAVLTEFIINCSSGQVTKFCLIDISCTVRTIGVTGTIISNGIVQNDFSPSALYASANTANVTFDSTATNLIGLTAKFNNAHSSNALSLQNGTIEIKNSVIA